MGEFCRIPLEALQYPQAFDKNPKLKRTYHVRRDRNRIKDKTKIEGCRRSSSEYFTQAGKSLSVDTSTFEVGVGQYMDMQLDTQASNAENVAGLGRPNIEISQPPNNNTPTTMKINNAAGKPGNRMSVKGRSRSIDNFDSKDETIEETDTLPSTTVIIKDKSRPTDQVAELNSKKTSPPLTRLEWWQDFDLLLQHPIGLRLFTEFLTKEFSEENIVFWKACEEYRKISDGETRATRAEEIFNLYLAGDAPEPVNVDSGARQTAKDAVNSAVETRHGSADIFLASQKQIYNLMKMDSFQRFLQSNLFKEFIEKNKDGSDLDGKQCWLIRQILATFRKGGGERHQAVDYRKNVLQFVGWIMINPESAAEIGKNKGESKKWSMTGLTALTNIIARAKSKEREAETEGPTRTFSSPDIAILSQTCPDVQFTRVVLPDKSTAILNPRPGETIGEMVQTLLRRRGEDKAFQAQTDKGDVLDILQRKINVLNQNLETLAVLASKA